MLSYLLPLGCFCYARTCCEFREGRLFSLYPVPLFSQLSFLWASGKTRGPFALLIRFTGLIEDVAGEDTGSACVAGLPWDGRKAQRSGETPERTHIAAQSCTSQERCSFPAVAGKASIPKLSKNHLNCKIHWWYWHCVLAMLLCGTL